MTRDDVAKRSTELGFTVEYGISNGFHYTGYPLGRTVDEACDVLDEMDAGNVVVTRLNSGLYGLTFY